MNREICRVQAHETCLGEDVRAEALALPSGIHVSVYGGQLSHIGAVTIVDPDGVATTVQFPGHRDGVVSERWAEAFIERGLRPAVIEAGIHYDGLTAGGIREVLRTTDSLLERLLSGLGTKK